MSQITEAQLKHLRNEAHRAFGFDFENDLRGMMRNMRLHAETLEQLSRADATKMINRLDEANDPDRQPYQFKRPR